jgi:hypothetical protein
VHFHAAPAKLEAQRMFLTELLKGSADKKPTTNFVV